MFCETDRSSVGTSASRGWPANVVTLVLTLFCTIGRAHNASAAPAPMAPVGAPNQLREAPSVAFPAPRVATVAATAVIPSVLYPPQTIPLRFDHAQHARAAIACERCHVNAAGSVSATDNLMPTEATCRGCHAIDRAAPLKVVPPGQPAARCEACHPGFSGVNAPGALIPKEPERIVAPPADVKFNHKLHAGRGVACTLCHANVETGGLATTADLPKMGLCLGCHDGRQATARCSACHLTLSDGRLRIHFAGGDLIPSGSLRGHDAHTSGFREDHRVAGKDERYCATCHKPTECIDCHGAGVVKPERIHSADYATVHGVDARRNTPNCSSCHRNQTFCLGCHQRLGVAADPEGGQPGRQPNNPFGTGTGVKRFHPPGWVRDDVGAVLTTPGPSSHSFQAKRNLKTCVSCHREESCLACHSADLSRSIGINPHGPGFAGSSACRAMSSRNTRGCLKCHSPGTPELSCQ